MIRDQLRHFEDSRLPQLLLQLDQLSKPATVKSAVPDSTADSVSLSGVGKTSSGENIAKPTQAEPKLVPARTIKVSYAKPWLTSEAELDDYLNKQREAWLREILAGNRVQI